MEIDDKENFDSNFDDRDLSCPLPPAVYTASRVQKGTRVDNLGREYAYIPEAYGEETAAALVTKHVGRMRVDRVEMQEERTGAGSFRGSSFDSSQSKRDSGLYNESTMEVSLVETHVVKKVTNKVK